MLRVAVLFPKLKSLVGLSADATMEQIETQVSDLRYLTSTPGERRVAGLPPLPVVASPVSVVSGENQLSPANVQASSADGTVAGGTKRKAEEEGNGRTSTKAQRSKRNRVSASLRVLHVGRGDLFGDIGMLTGARALI